jgi:hypothetical protein
MRQRSVELFGLPVDVEDDVDSVVTGAGCALWSSVFMAVSIREVHLRNPLANAKRPR